MEAKIFVIAFPTMETVAEKISSILDEAFNCKPKKTECKRTKCCEKPKKKVWDDLTPPKFKVRNEFGNAPIPEWGIGGTPADENLRFGYQAPPIDEPRCEDYDCRWEFEDDHEAYDKLVDAAEDCVARGLARPDGVIEHKCNAVRKRLNEAPPMNLPLIGETHWWETFEDFDF